MTPYLLRKDSKTISGYFLAPDKVDASSASDDDDDEENEDDGNNDEFDSVDFSEDKAFSPETHVVKPKSEKPLKVRFKEYGSGLVREIHGRFPLTDPWWSATLRIQKHQHHHHHQLMAILGYRLRDDYRVAEEKVLMLFLKACGVADDHRIALDEFLQHSDSSGLTFKNLDAQLDAFSKFSTKNKEIAKQIKCWIQKGESVPNAIHFPRLYEILPQLLPKHFFNIICLHDKILDGLGKALSERPWVFGFSSILTRDYKVHGCEASFKNFYNCSEVYSRLSGIEKDGLFIYKMLKELCCQEGHTFVKFQTLKSGKKVKRNLMSEIKTHQDSVTSVLDYTVVDWNKGFFFLEENGIIVLGVDRGHRDYWKQSWHRGVQTDTRVYLARFYFAEKDIAENLERLMFDRELCRWDVPIDLESDHFERLRTDKDQMRAAELIAVKPVVVLSGKGGCGKTEVVGRVFSYAQSVLAQERMFSQSGLTDEELVENADKQVSLYYADNGKHDLDGNSHESSSNGNDAIGNGESDETLAYIEVFNREKEPNAMLLPKQNCIKREVNESSVVLGGKEDHGSGSGDNSTESQGNGTASAVEGGQNDDGTILLTAPTGKAAILLGRRSGMPGYTLHQVVFSYFAWKRNPTMSWRFASVRVLIVDECSLVPVTIFQRVLKALLTDAQLSKVVLLGDVNQLPSIEPGRFLADCYEALEEAGCSITLRTNHRSESQIIVDNAELIRHQTDPVFYELNDELRHFRQIPLDDSGDNGRDEAVRDLLKKGILLGHEKSQFVAFRRRDCDGINELCCKHYNNHSMMKPGRKGKQVMDFRPGDKVCCSRNAYVIDYTDRDSTDISQHRASGSKGKAKELPEIRLCNGEIFFIKEMHDVQDERGRTTSYAVLSDLEREIKVNFRDLKNLCKVKHAWARTIHTFQGSETDALVYVVGSSVSYQNWQHVYTAVTRGRKQVHIVTEPDCLKNAIRKLPNLRCTSLKERLKSMIAKQLLQGSQPQIQEESRNVDEIHSSGETSNLNGSSLDQRPDFATPVKASPLQNHDVKSVSGGKRKHPDPSAAVHGSPSVKCAKDSLLGDSLVSPLIRQLSLNNV